jgi:hypothetical protein
MGMITEAVAQPHQFILWDLYLLYAVGHDTFQDIAVKFEIVYNIPHHWTVTIPLLVVETVAAVVIAKLLVRPAVDQFATIMTIFLYKEHRDESKRD